MASIQWYLLYGGLTLPVGSPSTDTEAVLSVNPERSTNGSQFECIVTDTSGVRYEETITIIVKGIIIAR